MIFIVVSTGHFDPLIEECCKLSTEFSFLGQIGSSTVVPNFPFFKTAPPPEIERHMRESELVISHGGAGMTAMLHRLRKRSVIIPKQMRYGEANDLQVELAQKWAELGMGELCLDVKNLRTAILNCRERDFQFPNFPSLGSYLNGLLGFSEAGHFERPASVPGGRA